MNCGKMDGTRCGRVGGSFLAATALLLGGSAITGCRTDGGAAAGPSIGGQTATLGSEPIDISVADTREVDLVEALVEHRQAYYDNLRRLQQYYSEAGNATKLAWTRYERDGFERVRKFRYVLDAEIPQRDLTASQKSGDADVMFEKGMGLMRAGGHGVPAVYREDRMIEAAEVFRTLIEKHPQSDKIDDAAFYLGEIHREYLPGQDTIAVEWYERAWQWDPNTPHPARFQAATVCDFRLHNRDKALELYREVIRRPESNRANARAAARRIEDLTGISRTAGTDGGS